jgi:MarR family transcriptional regulator, transcriptional regulator for hemolysin
MGKVKIYGFEMARISEVYLSNLSTILAPHGLERFYFPLLHLCENSGKLTQKDFAEALRRDKVFTMRVVDYLCDRGLVVRKKKDLDRRCQLLEVTNKAKELVPKIEEGIAKTDSLLFHNFSLEEKKVFKTGMTKLYETINSLPEPEFLVQAVKRKKN